MTIVNFTPKRPVYPAVQWDGLNTEEVDRVLNDSRYELVLNEEGDMIVVSEGREIPLRPGQWVMPAHKAVVVDDTELRQGFEEAP